jgi:predicted HicB family RNase H-like nuclease
MEYKGYVAQIEFDDSVPEFIGSTVNMRDMLVFSGQTVKELTKAFHEVVDEYLKWCDEDGVEPDKPYQGKLSLRIPPELHRDLDIAAASRGLSINAFIEKTVSDAIQRTRAGGSRRQSRAR